MVWVFSDSEGVSRRDFKNSCFVRGDFYCSHKLIIKIG